MKSAYRFILFLSFVSAVALLSVSCSKKLSSEEEKSKLDSAKTFYLQSEQLPPTQKNEIYKLVKESIRLLKEVINSNSSNLEAWYYYGYALDKQMSDGESSINLKTISYKGCEEISEIYEKIIDKDPKFTTDYRVSPYTRISSTWGALGLNYLIMKKQDSARIAFINAVSKGGITPANTEYCKNLLMSCNKNAILFVQGDIETFCLWKLQIVDKFRTDVTVVNIPMLNTAWYAKWLTKTNSLGAKLEISLNDTELDSLYINPSEYTDNTTKVINYKGQNPLLQGDFGTYNGDPVEFKLKGRSTQGDKILLFPYDYFVLSIIEKNLFQRPIYISLTCGTDIINSLGLNGHRCLEGIASRLFPYQIETKNSVDVPRIHNMLVNMFSWTAAKSETAFNDTDYMMLANYYKFVYIQLCYYYISIAPDKAKAAELYNKYFDVFTAVRLPLNEQEQKLFNAVREFIK